MKVAQTRTVAAPAKRTTPFFHKETSKDVAGHDITKKDAFFKAKNSTFPLQTKLTVGKPDDHYEHEADAMADKVVQRLSEPASIQKKPIASVSSISPFIQTKCAECEKEEKLQKKDKEEEKETPQNKLQKKAIFESNETPPEEGLQRKCEECEKEEKLQKKEKEDDKSMMVGNLQKKAIFESNEEPQQGIQKKSDPSSSASPSPKVESSLGASKGSGSPLPQQTRQQMESSFGADFSAVRVHDSSSAVQMNKDLHAQAFTHGSDIYFNSGKYDTSSKSGQHLLAHELTHVVQQKSDLVQKKASVNKPLEARGTSNQQKNSHIETSSKSPTIKSSLPEPENKLQKKEKEEEKELHGEKLQKKPVFEGNAEPPPDDNIQRKLTTTTNIIQKSSDDAEPSIPDKIKQGSALANGDHMEANGDIIEIHLEKFLLKNHVDKLPDTPVEKPKKGQDRKTDQGKKWRTETSPDVKTALLNIYKEKTANESISINLKKTVEKLKKTPDAPTAQIIGSSTDLSSEVAVPFWNIKGDKTIHQVEHAVDVQILGNTKADVVANLVLIDAESNKNLKDDVMEMIKKRVENLLTHYKINKDVTVGKALSDYKILFKSFEKDKAVKTKSIIHPGDFKKAKDENPISEDLIVVQAAEVPPGHLVLKTSEGSIGYILPYNFKSTFLELKGDASTHTLESVTFLKLMDDPKSQMSVVKPMTLTFAQVKGQQDYFKIDARLGGAADIIQKDLKFNFLSPVQLDDNFELNPHTGASVTGKIKTKVKPLENIDIDFYVRNGVFGIIASATFDKIKVPSPFHVRYATLALEANSNKDFSGSGEIGFGIDKFGEGRVNVSAGTNGLAFKGEFILDKKLFDGKITVGFVKGKNDEEGSWSFTGIVTIGKKKIPGLEKLTLTFSKEKDAMGGNGDAITAKGDAILSIPGIREVGITAVIAANGDWSIQGDIDLNKIPKLKGGSGKIFVQNGKDGWDVALEGKVKPDIDIQGLKVNEIAISYKKGVFDISTVVGYERGRVKGDFTLGATNNPVTEDGKKQEGDGGKEMKFYADGTINVTIAEGVGGAIHIKVKPEGDILLDGKVELTQDKPLFSPKGLDKTIFELNENIPLASCVVVTLSLHLGGHIKIYAHLNPLIFDKGSYIGLSNVSLKNFSNAKITSEINISSHFDAGVDLGIELGLDASLLGIVHAQVSGTGDLDFRALDADAHAHFKASWSAENGVQLEEGSVDIDLMSKLIATLGAKIRVYVNLLFTTLDIWEHKWEFARKEMGIRLFGDGKLTLPLPIGKDGGVSLTPGGMESNLSKVKEAAKPQNIADKSKSFLDHDGQTEEDKQAEANSIVKKEILEKFRDPQRLVFNKSVDYLKTRYELLNYLRDKAPFEKDLDLSYVEAEIKKAEFEEYEAFGPYIASETFDAGTKYTLIDEFIRNHPTLGETERINLRSNVVKDKVAKGKNAPPVQKKDEDEKVLQEKPDSSSSSIAANVESGVSSSKGSGSSLPHQTREQMESSLGADFSDVKIHDDHSAIKMNEALHAKAFTHGRDIYFNTGKYDTASNEGKHLLAHELTHVVQQSNGIPKNIQKVPVSELDGLYEGALNEKNWQKAAEYLNGFNKDDILTRLGKQPKGTVASIYTGAIENPVVGPNAQVAQFTRWAFLELNFKNEVAKQQWKEAAKFLNGFNDDDIKKYLSGLDVNIKVNLRNAAIPNNFNAVVKNVNAEVDFQSYEKARIAKLEDDYNLAIAKKDWKNAVMYLNAYNDEDLRIKLTLLNITSPESVKLVRSAADNQEENSRVGKFAQAVVLGQSTAIKDLVAAGPLIGDVWTMQFIKGMEISGVSGRFGESWNKIKENLSDLKNGAKFLSGIYVGYPVGVVKDVWDNISGLVELAWDLIKLSAKATFAPDELAKEIITILQALPELILKLMNGEEIGYQVGLYLSKNIKQEFINKSPFDQGSFIGEFIGRISTEIALLFVGVEEVNAVAKSLKATKWGAAIAESIEATEWGKALIKAKGAGKALRGVEEIAMDAEKMENALSKMARIEEKAPNITEDMMKLEERVMHERIKTPSKIMKSSGTYDAEITISEHTYKRNAIDGTWCRFSAKVHCDVHMDDSVNKAVSDTVHHDPPNKVGDAPKGIGRPTFVDSERHAIDFTKNSIPSDDWEEQAAFLYGKRVTGNPRNSTIPELYSAKLKLAVEVKDYDIAWSYDKLISNIVNQQGGRKMSLPAGTKQLLFVDVRGQGFTDIDGLGKALRQRLGNNQLFDKIHIMSDKGILIY